MDDVIQTIIYLLVAGVWILVQALGKRKQQASQPEPQPSAEPDWDDTDWQDEDFPGDPRRPDPHKLPEVGRSLAQHAPAPAPQQSWARVELLNRIERLRASAQSLVDVARVDWATMGIAQTLEDFVVGNLKLVRADVDRVDDALLVQLERPLAELELVHEVIAKMIEQRRNPRLRNDLGDADKLAAACYEPIIDFANAGRIRLSTSTPVAMLEERFDLGIWVGFIPTGIAPIFLPPYFLQRVVWWPALAHEIGHDFLAAAHGVEDQLRAQLGLPSEEVGSRPLQMGPDGLPFFELYRIFGGWFEEIFCDVFATMMIGPAYGYTMVELFGSRQDPASVYRVNVEPHGRRYGPHPPRHLRLITVVTILELVGEREEAAALRREWTELHGEPVAIDFPLVHGSAVSVPTGVLEELIAELSRRLYGEQMRGLAGHALYDIPALDYGPAEAAASRRARDELLAGQVPASYKARAVIGGLVLAWRKARHREAELLDLAHHAIVGVTEHREDLHEHAYDSRRAPSRVVVGADDKTDAVVLHTLLGPPAAVRAMGHARGVSLAAGFIEPAHSRRQAANYRRQTSVQPSHGRTTRGARV